MHDDIVRFISKHHVAALSIRDEEYTWSCCCYYSFIPSDPALLFLSNSDTRHAKLMLQTPYVSGTISRQTKSVFRIQGVQFKGVARITDSVQMRQSYSKRFPFVCLTDAELWTLRLDYVKFTSNIVKFGKKLYWERTER
jgi:uncharacterized protein YhbP (UPF0306 family)